MTGDAFDDFLARAVDVDGERAGGRATPSVEALAGHWRAAGVRPGDVVVLVMHNSAFLLRHLFALLAAGAVPAPVSPSTPAARLRSIADRFGARAVAAERLPDRLELSASRSVGELQVQVVPGEAPPAAAPGEVVLMTSGTSGFSSGCLFDLSALARNARRHAEAVGLQGDDVILVNLPLHFSYALVAQAMAAWQLGARLVIAGPPFNVEAYQAALARHRVTASSLTPLLVRQVLASRELDLARLRVLTIGGDAIAPAQLQEMIARAGGREVYVTYGLTQAGPRVATLAAHRETGPRLASVGLPLPGTRVELDGAAGPDGARELLVQSDTLMKSRIGLVERPRGDWAAPGTLATGDLFTRDAGGYLFFQGRADDVISTSGEKVLLSSVRRLAGTVPGVLSARTVVRRDGDQTVYDLVLTAQDAPATVREAVLRMLRRTEWPRHIEVVPGHERSSYK